MAERSARPRLAIILAIATLCMRSTMATNFLAYSSWTLGCTGMQDNVPGDCNSGLATLITYVYENVFPELAPAVNDTDRLSQVSASCITCAPRLFNATVLNTTLPAGDPATCPLLPGTTLLSTAAARVGAFACATDPGETQGACVRNVTLALQAVTAAPNLLQRVRSFDPNLRFTGPTLAGLCEQLMDSRVPSPTRGSCCLRSWAYLMAGLAQQACAPELANEYLALTGRCEALLGREAPAFCVADWERLVLPLLQAPPPARCAALPSPSPVSVAPLNPMLPWLYGTACGANQLARAACGSACDLWCGMVAASTEPGDEASPSPRSGSSSDDDSLRVSTLVIICVFSVLILIVLLVLLYWACAAYQERRQGEREQFSLVLEPNMIVAGIDDGGGGTAASRGLSGTKGVSGGGFGGSGGGSLPISVSARAAPPGLMAPAAAIVAGSAAAAAIGRASNAPPRSSMQESTGISTPHGPLTTSEPGSPGRSSRGTPAQVAVQQRYQPGVYGLSPSMQWRAGSAVDEPSPKHATGPVFTLTRTEAEAAGGGIVGGGGQPSTPRYGPGAAAAAAAAAAMAALASPGGGGDASSSAEVTPVRPDPPTAPTVNITDPAGEYGPVITFSPAASPETVAAAEAAAAAAAATTPATPDTPVVPAGPPPATATTTRTTAVSPPPAVGRSATLGFSTPPRPVVYRTGLPLTPAAAPSMPRAAAARPPPPLPLPPAAAAPAPPSLAASGSGSQGVSPFVLMASASAGAAAAATAATGAQSAAAPTPTAAATPAPAPATLAPAPAAADAAPAALAPAPAPAPAAGAGSGTGAAAGAATTAAAAVAEGQRRQEADPAADASASGGSSDSAALAAAVGAAAGAPVTAAAGAGPSDSVTTSNLTAAAAAVAVLRSHQLRHSDSQETFYSVQEAFNSGSHVALSRDSLNSYVTARSVPGSAHGAASAGGGTSAHSLGGGLSPAGPGTAVHSGALSPVNHGGVGVGMSNLGPGAGAGALVLQPQGSGGGGGGAQGAPSSGEGGAAGGGGSQQGQQQQGQGQGHARRMSDLPTVQEDL